MTLNSEIKSAVNALERAQKEAVKLAEAPLTIRSALPLSSKDARIARIELRNIMHRAQSLLDAVKELSG